MNLEIGSQIASILSVIIGIFTLTGLNFIYKKINNKQENKPNVVVNGSATFDSSFNVSNKIDEIKE